MSSYSDEWPGLLHRFPNRNNLGTKQVAVYHIDFPPNLAPFRWCRVGNENVKDVSAQPRVLIWNSGPRAQHVPPSHHFVFIFLLLKLICGIFFPPYTQFHLFWWITCHTTLSPHCNASMKLVPQKTIAIFSGFSWGIDAQRGLFSFLSRAFELWYCCMNVKAVDTAVSERSCLSVWTLNMTAVLYLLAWWRNESDQRASVHSFGGVTSRIMSTHTHMHATLKQRWLKQWRNNTKGRPNKMCCYKKMIIFHPFIAT